MLFLNRDGTAKKWQLIADQTGGGPTWPGATTSAIPWPRLGDLDGDGVTDLAVGAYLDDTGGDGRGAMYVLLMNPDGTAKATKKIAHQTAGGPTLANSDFFGTSVASLGDLNGDGLIELAVGASGDDTGGSSRGAVHVLALRAIPPTLSVSLPAGACLGGRRSGGGDRDSDPQRRRSARPADRDADQQRSERSHRAGHGDDPGRSGFGHVRDHGRGRRAAGRHADRDDHGLGPAAT